MILSSNWAALKSSGLSGPFIKGKIIAKDKPKKKPTDIKKSHSHLIALDCEMVEGTTIEHMLARVSLVDFEGRIVYDAYVKPTEAVVDYRTGITGITKEILDRKGEQFSVVRKRAMEYLKGKVVVGHAVHHDFEALKIAQPDFSQIRDTCLYSALKPPGRKSTPSLRLLAEYWLDKNVQENAHSSVEDARTAMMIYKRFAEQWESHLEKTS
jgi:RNA exonuclease 4